MADATEFGGRTAPDSTAPSQYGFRHADNRTQAGDETCSGTNQAFTCETRAI